MFLWFRCSYYVELISEELNYIIAKEVSCIFLALKHSKMVNSSVCIYLPLLGLIVNSVEICDFVRNLLNSDHHLAL